MPKCTSAFHPFWLADHKVVFLCISLTPTYMYCRKHTAKKRCIVETFAYCPPFLMHSHISPPKSAPHSLLVMINSQAFRPFCWQIPPKVEQQQQHQQIHTLKHTPPHTTTRIHSHTVKSAGSRHSSNCLIYDARSRASPG